MSNLKGRFPGGEGEAFEREKSVVANVKRAGGGSRITKVMGLDSIKSNGNHKPPIKKRITESQRGKDIRACSLLPPSHGPGNLGAGPLDTAWVPSEQLFVPTFLPGTHTDSAVESENGGFAPPTPQHFLRPTEVLSEQLESGTEK